MNASAIRLRPISIRSGSTMVEFLLFLALLGLTGSGVIALSLSTAESRVEQQITASVEQEGTRLLQAIIRRARNAERILAPLRGSSGSLLALRTSLQNEDPTIIALQSGALILIRAAASETLSAPDVTVSRLRIENTSASDERPSMLLSFTVGRSLALPVIFTYERTFESAVSLFPDDNLQGNACGCAPPVCSSGNFSWGFCSGSLCTPASVQLSC
jgi:hypothetical protein